jgi:hypothetical protein
MVPPDTAQPIALRVGVSADMPWAWRGAGRRWHSCSPAKCDTGGLVAVTDTPDNGIRMIRPRSAHRGLRRRNPHNAAADNALLERFAASFTDAIY